MEQFVKMIKLAWLLTCFGIGVVFFNTGQFSGEYAVLFLIIMKIVTFPIGYLAIYLLRAIMWVLPAAAVSDMAGAYYFAMSVWVLMTVFGYFQWFYLVPKIVARVKASKNA